MFIALAKGAIHGAGGHSRFVMEGGHSRFMMEGGHSRFIKVYRCTEMGNVADSQQQGFISVYCTG